MVFGPSGFGPFGGEWFFVLLQPFGPEGPFVGYRPSFSSQLVMKFLAGGALGNNMA